MSFYGYRSTEMLREIAKWADERATVILAHYLIIYCDFIFK